MTLEDLKAELDKLSPVKIEFIARMARSLSNPPQVKTGRETWITEFPDWIEYFGVALSVHHGTTTEPLSLVPFETVFRNTCEYVGWHTDKQGSATQRFVDMAVSADGTMRKLSLKSTAAKKLSENTLHISKLTEAAWIQDTRTPGARQNAMPRPVSGVSKGRRRHCHASGVSGGCGADSNAISTSGDTSQDFQHYSDMQFERL